LQDEANVQNESYKIAKDGHLKHSVMLGNMGSWAIWAAQQT